LGFCVHGQEPIPALAQNTPWKRLLTVHDHPGRRHPPAQLRTPVRHECAGQLTFGFSPVAKWGSVGCNPLLAQHAVPCQRLWCYLPR